MGFDANVYIKKSLYTKKDIEDLLILLGYEKRDKMFYFGNDREYKHLSGVAVYLSNHQDNDDEYVYHVRMPYHCTDCDIKKANDTMRSMRKYCNAWFESDEGKNRYFQHGDLVWGAENGCYYSAERSCYNLYYLKKALEKYPEDSEGEKMMNEWGAISPNRFNANIYLTYLCAVLEEYFRSTFIALLRFSDKKEKVLNCKLSPYELIDIDSGKTSVEEAYARTVSFQNVKSINKNFMDLEKIDIMSVLKEPYHGRKKSLYTQMDEIFERRHRMVHRVDMDSNYDSRQLRKDIDDMDAAIKRVYKFLCKKNEWEDQDIF